MNENNTNDVEAVAQVVEESYQEKKSSTNRDIEKEAKAAIKERGFFRIVGFMVVLFLLTAIGGGGVAMLLGQGVESIIQWVVTFILANYFIGVIKREKFDMGIVRTSFIRIGSIVGVLLLSTLIIMIPFLIVGVVFAIVFFAGGFYSVVATEPAKLAVFMAIAGPFLFIAGIITLILSYRYRLIYFILGDKKLLPVSVIVKRSSLLMDGYKGKGFCMELKYGLSAYAILALLSIPLFFVKETIFFWFFIPVLMVCVIVLFLYVATILGAYWANLYETRKADLIEVFEADEELYPNYKMTTLHTVLLVGGVVLVGFCIFIMRLFLQILPSLSQ